MPNSSSTLSPAPETADPAAAAPAASGQSASGQSASVQSASVQSPQPVWAPSDEILRRGRPARLAWMALGLLLVGIGVIGIFVPLLPTTDFMILALPCFARSSPRLEAWLLNHPRFGPGLRAWRAERAIPRPAKIASLAGMTIGFVSFCLIARPGPLPALGVAAVLLGCATWVIRRREPRGES
ncbi:YbaN family protein [Novosphingobium sp. ST904]|uniref:YbaN family protein n=2 Tax=unclassified Novosphingobium TaxID=2644732 RepID=UPI000AF80BF6